MLINPFIINDCINLFFIQIKFIKNSVNKQKILLTQNIQKIFLV
jgi:hypothetical protein